MEELTLSRRRPLSYRNQPIDLLSKSMDCFPISGKMLQNARILGFTICVLLRENQDVGEGV